MDATVFRHKSSPRAATLAYDEITKRVVLFGGNTDGIDYGDRWTYNGVDWVQQQLAMTPMWSWPNQAQAAGQPGRCDLAGGESSCGSHDLPILLCNAGYGLQTSPPVSVPGLFSGGMRTLALRRFA